MMKVKSKESEIVMLAAAAAEMPSSAVLDLSNDDGAAAAEEEQDAVEGHEHCAAGTEGAEEVSAFLMRFTYRVAAGHLVHLGFVCFLPRDVALSAPF